MQGCVPVSVRPVSDACLGHQFQTTVVPPPDTWLPAALAKPVVRLRVGPSCCSAALVSSCGPISCLCGALPFVWRAGGGSRQCHVAQ